MTPLSLRSLSSALLVLATGAAVATASEPVRHTTQPSLRGAITTPSDNVRAWTPEWPSAAPIPPNSNVSNRAGYQGETTVAVDPTDPNHILSASNDLNPSTGVYESFDGGATWTRSDAGITGGNTCYDPWLSFNSAGDAFFGFECFSGANATQGISYKDHGSSTWTALPAISAAGAFPDRDMVAVDRGSSSFANSVYIGFDDASANNAAYLLVSRSGKGASSWSRSSKINDASATIGVNACVADEGTVYAFWEDFSGQKLWVDRSTDGGMSWNQDILVTNYRINTTGFSINIPPQNVRGVTPFPFSAIAPPGSPHAGRIYVTYMDVPSGSAETKIYLRYSDTQGKTWSAEKLVSNAGISGYCFHPNIAVANDGTVCVNFNATRATPNTKVCMIAGFSHDGGDTWTDQQVADKPSDETISGADQNQYGDYQGCSVGSDGIFSVVWCDSRTGNQAEELYWAKLAAVAAPVVGKTARDFVPTATATEPAPLAAHPYKVTVAQSLAGRARLAFNLPASGDVSLQLLGVDGRVVRTLMRGYTLAGDYDVLVSSLDDGGRALSKGVYFYKLVSQGHVDAGKIVIAQ